MRVPEHLAHKPIIGVDNYDKLDGKYANNTDAKALSIGKAQWNSNDISAKVWRHTGEKWTRQSEELPIHRVLDLSILILSAYINRDIKYITQLNEVVINYDDINLLYTYLEENEQYIKPRIYELQNIINKIKL